MRTLIGLFIPAVIVFAVLIALGTWQLQRKAWKEDLIATLTERLAAPPGALPAPATWPRLDRDDTEYRRVTFTATFDDGKEALVSRLSLQAVGYDDAVALGKRFLETMQVVR